MHQWTTIKLWKCALLVWIMKIVYDCTSHTRFLVLDDMMQADGSYSQQSALSGLELCIADDITVRRT